MKKLLILLCLFVFAPMFACPTMAGPGDVYGIHGKSFKGTVPGGITISGNSASLVSLINAAFVAAGIAPLTDADKRVIRGVNLTIEDADIRISYGRIATNGATVTGHPVEAGTWYRVPNADGERLWETYVIVKTAGQTAHGQVTLEQ